MSFKLKIFVSTSILMAFAFSIGGYILITSVFNSSHKDALNKSFYDNQILGYNFEIATNSISNPAASIKSIVNDSVKKITVADKETKINIRDTDNNLLHGDKSMPKKFFFKNNNSNKWETKIINYKNRYYTITCNKIDVYNNEIYFNTIQDITNIFRDKNDNLRQYQISSFILLSIACVIIYIISHILTKPIKQLVKATHQISSGNYDVRIKTNSKDEIGFLGENFNAMADQLNINMKKMETEVKQKELFIGSFAHELKTPLTSIIGYADMLRSYNMKKEDQIDAFQYIFSEGKRLETLSIKLLDLIVLQQKEITLETFNSLVIKDKLKMLYLPLIKEKKFSLNLFFEESSIVGDPTLLVTLLVNLIDNAYKAIETNGAINVTGKIVNSYYQINVVDNGCGIPRDEIVHLSRAFYKVDKSRTSNKSGAGIGLNLCSEIIKLHNTQLQIKSKINVGTSIYFNLSRKE